MSVVEPSLTSQRLSDAAVGTEVLIARLDGPEPLCRRLRELGFCEEARVRKLSDRRLLLCAVCGSRVAIDRQMAQHVLVEDTGLV